MEKLNIETGIKEYQLGEFGVLRMNPTDTNIYSRFLTALENIQEIEGRLLQEGEALGDDADGKAVLDLLDRLDKDVKAELNTAFGYGNDFDKIVCGANLLTVCDNGERLVTNILVALEPIIMNGIQKFVITTVDAAKLNREQRRAVQHSGKVTIDTRVSDK